MTDLKRLVALVMLLTFVAGVGAGTWVGTLTASPPERSDPRTVEKRLEDFRRILGLDATQVRRLRPVLLRHDREVRSIRENLSARQRREIAEVRRKARRRIEAILTPQQRQEWSERTRAREDAGG